MKKFITFAFAMLLALLLLVACSGSGDNSNGENNQKDDSKEDLNLSGVLYDFTFKLEGDTITLPIMLEEFQSYGWEPTPTLELAENIGSKTLGAAIFVKNGKELSLGLINLSDETLPIQKCMVYSLKSYSYDDYVSEDDHENYAVIELPKGIILGVSTKDDVLRAYGNPSQKFFTNDEETELREVLYYGENFRNVEIITDKRKNNVVVEIEINNRGD